MKSPSRRKIWRAVGAIIILVLAACIIPSFFSAERYRRRLEAGLEQALHRPVTFGALSLRLLPRPGFTLKDAVVREDPAFGSEPFARVEQIECDLTWRSLWHSRLDFARLRLDRASFNFVRNAQGEWNFENLLLASGVALPRAEPSADAARPAAELELEADDARINFKVGVNKKPFAITGLRALLDFDPARRLVKYRLAGNPLRTDLSLPTPGVLELAGEWTPGKDLDGPLNATLRTRGAMLYDWVPLVTGHNPEIYGVLDADIHLTGSIHVINVDGLCQLSQLHRWEELPPSEPMPAKIYIRGEFNRRRGRALLDSLEVSFADSHLHLSGSVDGISSSPELDLLLALERSRLEDLLALVHRFGVRPGAFGLSGRVDGMLAIQGPWLERRYGGFLSARNVRLTTPSGTFPVSDAALRMDNRGARLAPVRLTLAPRVELLVEGALDRPVLNARMKQAVGPLRYELVLSAKAIPLGHFLRFARAIGIRGAQNLDAQGVGSAAFHLAGSVWPLTRPALVGHAELQAARLLMPGLTEPLNFPRARLQVSGEEVVIDPVVAVIGTSLFSGRLEHRGDRKQPWGFDLRANHLSLEEGALWFDVLGRQRPVPLLERLPGLSSFAARRVAASNLFSALNVKGRFSASTVTYRALTLKDFRASVEISGRMIRVASGTFRAGGGRGQGKGQVDLTSAPAHLTADVTLAGANLPFLAPRLAPVLRRLRGSYSGSAHIETRGLTHHEMSANLRGQATVRLKNVNLGDFDPLGALARESGWGSFEPARGEVGVRTSTATLRVLDRRVVLENNSLDVAGAKLRLAGTYNFDGAVDLDVRADLRHVRRRWLSNDGDSDSAAPRVSLHLAGPIDKLAIAPEVEALRAIQ